MEILRLLMGKILMVGDGGLVEERHKICNISNIV